MVAEESEELNSAASGAGSLDEVCLILGLLA